MKPLISIIHPSRGRPEQAAETAKKWLTSAKSVEQIEYALILDSDDTSDYKSAVANILQGHTIHLQIKDNHNCVEAMNAGALLSTANLLVCISDDISCPAHWDDYLLKQLQDKRDYIVKCQDQAQPWIITLPIMDRTYYNRFGYIYNPIYQHMFADTEMTAVADLLGRKIELPAIFKHNHYSLVGKKPDAVSSRADATWAQGEALYLDRIKNNFGLTAEEIRSPLTPDWGHMKWLEAKGVKLEYV